MSVRSTPSRRVPRSNVALAKRKLWLSQQIANRASSGDQTPDSTPGDRTVTSSDGKTIIHIHCNGGGGNGGRGGGGCGGGNNNWCNGPNTCPVYDSLGYPYYPQFGTSLSWITGSPLVPWGVPLPPPACPPCGVNVPYQGFPGAWQFPQVAPSFMSNVLPQPRPWG